MKGAYNIRIRFNIYVFSIKFFYTRSLNTMALFIVGMKKLLFRKKYFQHSFISKHDISYASIVILFLYVALIKTRFMVRMDELQKINSKSKQLHITYNSKEIHSEAIHVGLKYIYKLINSMIDYSILEK